MDLRTDEFALIERTTLEHLPQAIKARDPGQYSIGVTLPSGIKLSQDIAVTGDGQLDFNFLISRFLDHPTVNAFARHYAARALLPNLLPELARKALRPPARAFTAEGRRSGSAILARAFAIAPDQLSAAVSPALMVRHGRDAGSVVVAGAGEGHGGSVLLQVLREGHPASNIMLPGGVTLTLGAPGEQ